MPPPASDPWPPGIPRHPPHPERICWGCDQLCPVTDMRCGSEVVRAMHPCEMEDAGDQASRA
ncbi:MAG: DUF3079 domain-containing protein [Acidobacteria bacterium]|nr:DUF3079 domain-containing protein [Acidobacteriota bacterium]